MDQCTLLRIVGCTVYLSPDCWPISSLKKQSSKHGYYQSKLVPGLWLHKWRPVQFTLVVDDFGQVCWRRTCPPPQNSVRRRLHPRNQIGRQEIHWHHIRLGLQAQAGPLVHAKLCGKNIEAVQARGKREAIRAVPLSTNQVWCEKSNTRHKLQQHRCWTRKENVSSNKCVASFYFLDVQLIAR